VDLLSPKADTLELLIMVLVSLQSLPPVPLHQMDLLLQNTATRLALVVQVLTVAEAQVQWDIRPQALLPRLQLLQASLHHHQATRPPLL